MKCYTFATKYVPGLERTRRQKTKGGEDTRAQSKGVSPVSLKCLASQQLEEDGGKVCCPKIETFAIAV